MPPVKNTIFLCYRRDDSADVTGRIYDRLEASFLEDAIFRDVDNIPLGVDFRDHVATVLRECRVVFVVIGPMWLELKDERERRRLEDPRDNVRIEVEHALSRKDLPVIPVLVGGARMPHADQLPESLRDLAFKNGAVVRRDPDFRSDMARLISETHRLLDQQLRAEPSSEASPAIPLATRRQTDKDPSKALSLDIERAMRRTSEVVIDARDQDSHPIKEVANESCVIEPESPPLCRSKAISAKREELATDVLPLVSPSKADPAEDSVPRDSSEVAPSNRWQVLGVSGDRLLDLARRLHRSSMVAISAFQSKCLSYPIKDRIAGIGRDTKQLSIGLLLKFKGLRDANCLTLKKPVEVVLSEIKTLFTGRFFWQYAYGAFAVIVGSLTGGCLGVIMGIAAARLFQVNTTSREDFGFILLLAAFGLHAGLAVLLQRQCRLSAKGILTVVGVYCLSFSVLSLLLEQSWWLKWLFIPALGVAIIPVWKWGRTKYLGLGSWALVESLRFLLYAATHLDLVWWPNVTLLLWAPVWLATVVRIEPLSSDSDGERSGEIAE